MTSTRRRIASLIAFGTALTTFACGGDGLTVPEDARPTTVEIVSGNGQSADAGAPLGEDLVVVVKDAVQRPVEGQAVTFSIDAGGGAVAPAMAVTGADGQASTAWTLGTAAGQQRVQVRVAGTNIPTPLLANFSASALTGAGAILELVSGDNQRAAVGSALPDPLVVRVTDAQGNPVAGVTVDWTAGGGGTIDPATVVTDPDGRASAERVLGTSAGTQTAQAASAGLTPVGFIHTAEAANPTSLRLISGNDQTGAVAATLADSLVVRLEDGNGNGVGGKPVTWVVATGGGTVSPVTATTDPNGLAATQWTLGPAAGLNQLNAVFSGLPSVAFAATAGAGGASKLAFIQPPVTSSAGSAIAPPVRVAIQDAAGNTVTSASDAVTIAIGANPAGGTLSGTVSASAVGGVATFSNLSIDRPGVGYTLTASAGGLAGATSPAFDILTGNANRLVFITDPTDRVVGQTFSPDIQVQVQDAGGNPVLTATSPITIASSVGGSLGGTAVANPVLGVATFPNLSISKAGQAYTLTALSSGVVSSTSPRFTVTEAATTVEITTLNPASSAVPGQNVTVGYNVDVTPPGAGQLGGSVTVSDGTTSCTGVINGTGMGSCPLTLPTAGTRNLVATYSGGVNFLSSISAPVSYTVDQATTNIAITSDAPDASAVGAAVTVRWRLTSPSSTALGGTVKVAGGTLASEMCESPAALGVGSCQIAFGGGDLNPTITATYSGDANYLGSTDTESHRVLPANTPPTAVDDPATGNESSYTVGEDGSLTVGVNQGVLKNDTDAETNSLTALNASTPANGTVDLAANGSFTYVPNADFNGTDSFTYQASDGSLSSAAATVTITVTAVNDAPGFTKGPDTTVSASGGAVTRPGWATGLSRGPTDESAQTLAFTASISSADQLLFSVPPGIAPDGTLTFTPSGAQGSSMVTVSLKDNGGTANGGADTSPPQTFTITLGP